MKKEILIALICASLMLVTPFSVAAQENKVTDNLKDEPDIEGLVAQLRVVINEILQKYGHIPIVANLCGIILDTLGLIGNIIICILLILIFIPFAILAMFFGLVLRWDNVGMFFFWICFAVVAESRPYCTPYNFQISRQLLKSLYTLSETNDIPDFSDCSCLQE